MSRVVATQQQPATGSVEVSVGDVSFTAREGQRLIELCDLHLTPLHFGCRAGACGTCLVRVVEGMENLSAVTTNEEILLPALTDDPAARLACQLLVLGPVCLVPMPLY
jgi:2Fe-2S ferredoxin